MKLKSSRKTLTQNLENYDRNFWILVQRQLRGMCCTYDDLYWITPSINSRAFFIVFLLTVILLPFFFPQSFFIPFLLKFSISFPRTSAYPSVGIIFPFHVFSWHWWWWLMMMTNFSSFLLFHFLLQSYCCFVQSVT